MREIKVSILKKGVKLVRDANKWYPSNLIDADIATLLTKSELAL